MESLNRRDFIVQASSVLVGGVMLASCAASTEEKMSKATQEAATVQAKAKAENTFVLPPLGYDYRALEPSIDEKTMKLHYEQHHATYVKNLNAALKGQAIAKLPIEDILQRLDTVPENIRDAVQNNAGGHLNHTLYWESMKPGGSKVPTGPLANAVKSTFGKVETLQKRFEEVMLKSFGSGWVWLVLNKQRKLAVTTTPNQDNPLTEGLYPLLGSDVWEHAYYLKYQNRRTEYLMAWWNVVNWDVIGKRYDEGMKKG